MIKRVPKGTARKVKKKSTTVDEAFDIGIQNAQLRPSPLAEMAAWSPEVIITKDLSGHWEEDKIDRGDWLASLID